MLLNPMQDYDDTAARFTLNLPKSFNFGRDVVDAQALRADKAALIWCNSDGLEQRFNFSDIARLSNQVANQLTRHGVSKGDRVVVLLPRLPAWQINMVACMKIGAIPIPCIEMLTTKDVDYRVEHSGAIAAITTANNTQKFLNCSNLKVRLTVDHHAEGWLCTTDASSESGEFECDDTQLEDPALLYYTSGSSGQPKGVLHASRAIYSWRLSAAWWQTLIETDTKWCTADTGWAKAGTGILFGPWSRGSCVLFYDGKFDVQQRLTLLAKYRVSVFCAPATEFRHLITADMTRFDLSALRLCVSAGESVNPDVVSQWHTLTGAQLLDGYGQTETLMTILNYPCLPVKPGSMGKPVPGLHFEVLKADTNDELLPDGQHGQLALRLPSDQFMLGYWNDPERTAKAITQINGESYWLTGDLGYRDSDGYLFYSGRNDDVISSAAYRIGPTEVENALQAHPAVIESAVVASPDAERGEIVKAFVILHAGFEPNEALIEELQQHVKETTAPYKYPRKIDFVTSLPKNPSGKLLRRVLRDQEFAANSPSNQLKTTSRGQN